MPESQEGELVGLVAKGDQQALLELYDRYASRVYALTLRVLRDSMAAEEVTQDVFLRLWSRARLYVASRGTVSTWLLTIARNASLDRLRLERRRLPASNEMDPDSLLESIPERTASPEELRWRGLSLALQGLPVDQRRPIELAYYQGLSHSQIAEELGWPIGTVKTRLRLGMEQLRRNWLGQDVRGKGIQKPPP
ncbi:MAG: sigma-70 family RNA polymerase sigma factor [Anaerolineales bacterium]